MDNLKEVTLTVRMTKAEKLKLRVNAAAEGLRLSNYVRNELRVIPVKTKQ